MEDNKSKDLLDKDNKGACTEGEKAIGESWFINWKKASNGLIEEKFERMDQEVLESILLSDGSKAWLNANSKISFPIQFSGKERKVSLSGEAYFEVKKGKRHPFIVPTGQQNVKVLGSHFNISAYDDEKSTKITLPKGSVRVSLLRKKRNNFVIRPNEQFINLGSTIEVKPVDSDDVIAWKNGGFAFNNEPLSSIMSRLARWYDVEISYQNDGIAKKRLNGNISKFGKISETLSMLEITGEVHFKIEGRRINVMP